MKILYSAPKDHSLHTTVLNLTSTTFRIRNSVQRMIVKMIAKNDSKSQYSLQTAWKQMGKPSWKARISHFSIFTWSVPLTHSFPQSRSTDASRINKKTIKGHTCREAGAAPRALFLPPPYLHTSTIISAYQLLQVQGNDASVAWISPEEKLKKSELQGSYG